ncbi:unnamed protein product [Aphanomyces euteiches]
MWHAPTKVKSSRESLLSSARAAREEREAARRRDVATRLLQRFLRGRMCSWQLTRERTATFDKQSRDIQTLLEMKIPLPLVALLPTIRLGMSLFGRSNTIAPELKPRLLQVVALLTMYMDRENPDMLHPLCNQATDALYVLDRLVILVLYKLHVWHKRSPAEWSDREPLVDFLLRLECVLEAPTTSTTTTTCSSCLYPTIRKNLFRRIQESHLYVIAGEQIRIVVLSHIGDLDSIRPSTEAAYAAKLFALCMHKLVYKHQAEATTCYESYMSFVSNVLVRVPDMITRMGNYITPILQSTSRHLAVNWKIVGTTLRELLVDTNMACPSYHLDINNVASATGFEPQVYRDLVQEQKITFSPREALVGAVNCYSMAIQSEYIDSVDEQQQYGTPYDVMRLVKSFCGRAWCYSEEGRYILAHEDVDRAVLMLHYLEEMAYSKSKEEVKDIQRLHLDCYMIRARVEEELGLVEPAIDDYTVILKIGSKLLGLSTWKQMKERQTALKQIWARHLATRDQKQRLEPTQEEEVESVPVEQEAALPSDPAVQEGTTKKRKKKKKKAAAAAVAAPVPAAPKVAYHNNVTVKLAPFKSSEELKAEHNRITREIFLKESAEIAQRIQDIQAAASSPTTESLHSSPPPPSATPQAPPVTHFELKDTKERPPLPDTQQPPPKCAAPAQATTESPTPPSTPMPTPPLPKQPPKIEPSIENKQRENVLTTHESLNAAVFETQHHEPHLERKMSAEVKSNQTLEFILDGANIGFFHGRNMGQHKRKKRHFSARGIWLALKYFNHRYGPTKPRAVAFLPQRFIESRYEDNLADDVELLTSLMEENLLFLTPAGVDDDLFMLKYAEKHNLSIVTNDNLADHIQNAQLKLAMTPLVFTRTVNMSTATLVQRHVFGLKTIAANNVVYVDDQVVAYPAGHSIVVYGTDDKKQKFITCTENTEGITSLSVCSSRRFIAIAEKSERGVVSIYDLKTLKKRKVLTTSDCLSKTYVSMEFSTDNQLLLTQGGAPDWTLVCWNWSKGKPVATIKLAPPGVVPAPSPTSSTAAAPASVPYVNQCSFSNVDPSIVCCTGPSMIKFFRIVDTAFRPMPSSRVEAQNFLCHAWLKQKEDEVVVGTAVGDLLLFRAGEFLCRLLASPGDSRSITSMVPTSKGLVCGTDKAMVSLFVVNTDRSTPPAETLTFSKSLKLENTPCKVTGLTVSPNEETLVAAVSTSQLYIFPYQTKESFKTEEIEYLVAPFHRPGESGLLHVTGMDVCVRKPTIVTCGLDKTVRVWNYIDRTCEVHKQFTEEAHSVSMHPSGLQILVGFADKLRLMNVLMDDIRPYKEFTIKACRECQFSTGGHLFAAVNGNTIQVFSMNTCDLVANLRGHNGKVRSIYWNYDDSGLISAGMDGAVYQWDLDEAKRDGEFVQKGVPYFSAVCNREGTSVFAVGADKMLKEIEFPASTLSKEFAVDVTLGQIVLSNSQRMLFVGATEAEKLGTVRSYKFPLTGEFTEFQGLSGPITRMRISFDDLYLLVCGEDGVVSIFEIRDKEGRARAKDGRENTVFAEEILVTKSDLEEKNTLMIELKNKVDELTLHNEYQLRLKDMNYNEYLKELTEKFTHEIEQEKNKYEVLREDKNDIEMEYEEHVKQIEEKHQQQMQEIEANYQQKIMKEVEKYQDVLQQREIQRARWQQEQHALVSTHERYVAEVTEDFEQRLDEDRQLRMQMEDEREELHKEFNETKKQLEEDVDEEIESLKKRYEDKLAAEREATLRYKGENGIMKKKFTALQKDIEDQRDEIKNLLEKEKDLIEQIKALEKEIQALKREIRGRDETIGEKEKRIYDLKKKNQELEKFKFVLDYKIKELKRQIEPRENEIADMKEQIKEMDRELELFHKSNAQLDIMIGEQRKRLDKMQHDITRNRKIIGDQQSLIRRFRCDLHDCVQSIQNPKELAHKVALLYQKYVTTDINVDDVDMDIQHEYDRQKQYLEKSVEVLKRKYAHDVVAHQQDNNQARSDNLALIKEINELRAALNVSKATLQKDKAILGTRDYFTKKSGLDEDLHKVVETQRLEIDALRRSIKAMEERLETARTGGMLPPVRGIDG